MIAVNICISPDQRYPTIEDVGDPDRIVRVHVNDSGVMVQLTNGPGFVQQINMLPDTAVRLAKLLAYALNRYVEEQEEQE